MNNSAALRRLLLTPAGIRSCVIPFPRTLHAPFPRQYATVPSPNVAQHSFWLGLIPKPLRRSSPSTSLKKKIKSKEWNPATFFIIIFLFIGSMSIQMIALRNEFAAFSRRADAKISLLNEIIERIKNGEDVDVEGLLVLQEIEMEDAALEASRNSNSKRARGKEDKSTASTLQATRPVEKIEEKTPEPKTKSKAPAGFY
ncbi:uncharacterized protein BP5553_00604 [Venustampulla echinocandica]|uniref:Uncharacterized protein n=1 Tax=Venustampulla echinocandica TaxID=2656787 RepID=A0A370TYM9_9HELO|nr:uncharacterized protein BP5553_00604 [Venustampulla echinocandica]RDL40625.1 hypothetical protein BP5553_00604 [Venustampulla echinocandica]